MKTFDIIIEKDDKKININSEFSKSETVRQLQKYIQEQVTIKYTENLNVYKVISNENHSCLYFLNENKVTILTIDFKNKELLNLNGVNANNSYLSKINFNSISLEDSVEWFRNFNNLIKSDFIFKSRQSDCSINRYYKEAFKDFNILIVCEILAKQGFISGSLYLFNIQVNIYKKLELKQKIKIHKIIGISQYQFKLLKNKDLLRFLNIKNYFDSNYSIYYEYLLVKDYINTNCRNMAPYENLFKEKNITTNYDLYKLIDYLNIDCINQGMEYIPESIGFLIDYVNMNITMGIKNFIKYPKYLKTYHDIILKNYKIKLDDIKNNKYKNLKQKYGHLEFKKQEYKIILPETLDTIVKEGVSLNHCVSSYIDKVLDEKSIICFMRHENNLNESLITLEIINNEINQAKGQSNRNPTIKESSFLDSYKDYLQKINNKHYSLEGAK